MTIGPAQMARPRDSATLWWLLLLLPLGSPSVVSIHEASPPIYGAYPTGGPIAGGTSVTIFGTEFDEINLFPSEARCSWGDPREWQQATFAAQQARPRASLASLILPRLMLAHGCCLRPKWTAGQRMSSCCPRSRQRTLRRLTTCGRVCP